MNRIFTFALSIMIFLSISGCAIPDLPGPIGIPGIEHSPLSLQEK